MGSPFYRLEIVRCDSPARGGSATDHRTRSTIFPRARKVRLRLAVAVRSETVQEHLCLMPRS